MVSMANHYATLKNEVCVQKTHVSAATHVRKSNLLPNFLDIVGYFDTHEKMSSECKVA